MPVLGTGIGSDRQQVVHVPVDDLRSGLIQQSTSDWLLSKPLIEASNADLYKYRKPTRERCLS
jgi:hypothetical protein